MTTAQDQQSRAECRKAFEFDLIDNWAYVESDFALDANGLYADRELYFAWECAWASWQAARALPAGLEPDRYMDARGYTVTKEFLDSDESSSDYRLVYTEPLFTAAQVLAMGRVPPGHVPVPVEPTSKQIVLMAGAILHQQHGTGDTRHPCWPQAVEQAEKAYRAAIDFAPRPPAAQEGK